ncbi:neuroserpin [Trichonephila inaurata madagascariensis]|uniref:Neuroserpin n=1 Tax=Trichonephila inaurata madagascariensis TaxID=2747483 RepID=A0A8X6Y162_9ARAC|nr:neuroserpin [Trichonephila inaurata madagascariensis]
MLLLKVNILNLLVYALLITVTSEQGRRNKSLESFHALQTLKLHIPKLSEAINNFSFRLYACWHYNNVKNIYICPMTVMQVLSAFHFGLRGKSEQVFGEVLGYTDLNMTKMDVMEAFYLLTTKYFAHSNRRSLLNRASTILVKREAELIPAFKYVAEHIFQVPFTVIDVKESPERVVHYLNHWVAARTSNKIKNIMDEMRSLEDVIGINAVHFKAAWKFRFARKKTSKETFYNSGGIGRDKDIPMMHLTQLLKHYSAPGHRILELPFQNSKLSMYIFLPKFINGIRITELDLRRSIAEDFCKMEPDFIEVALPKFKFHCSAYLSKCLSMMDDGNPFIPDSEDLSVMFRNKSLSLGEMYHTTYIEVTEEGVDVPSNIPKTPIKPLIGIQNTLPFKVNHPFLFLIKDLRTGIILFIGRVEEI